MQSYRKVIAICDSELVGKVFEEGNFQLDVKESFYKGEESSREEVIQIIKKMSVEDATFNIVGKESVNLAIEIGITSKENVKKIQGVPFTFVLV